MDASRESVPKEVLHAYLLRGIGWIVAGRFPALWPGGLRVGEEPPDRCRGIGGRRLLDDAAFLPGDLGHEPVRDDRARLGREDVLRGGELVTLLDEEPCGPCRGPAPGAHEDPRAAQLLAVERELDLALAECRVHVGTLRCPRAAIPDHHGPCAVLALRDHALEVGVLERMVLDPDREPP